jgi:hypothetical protein
VAEVAYNLLDSCKRYSYDADIELFHKILLGLLDDDVYTDQMAMLTTFKERIRAFCTDEKVRRPWNGRPWWRGRSG